MGFLRVRLGWNFDNPLQFQRNFQLNANENTIIKYRFERLRNFCTKCGSLKHDVKECELTFENDNAANEEGDHDGDNQDNDHHDEQEMSDEN